jgi:N-acetylneuraminate synthase
MQDNISHQIGDIASKSKTNEIFIIGKGPSLDFIDCAYLPSGTVINLNDSERIHPGDIGIFSANWVRHSLRTEGFRCRYYLAGRPLPPEIPHDVLPAIPIDLDENELEIVRLEKEEFFDESFVLLNALKLSLLIQRMRGQPQNVYFLGFDFSTVGGSLSRKIGADFSGSSDDERDAIIISQESAFRQFLHYFSDGKRLRIHHIGNRDYSSQSPIDFSRNLLGASSRPLGTPINLADPDRVLIVAELTNNHLGDPIRLVELVERSKEAGADLIKVQKRHVDSFYSREQLASYYWSPFGETLGDYRRGVELDDELLDLLEETCRKCEIEWFCSVLDYPSFEEIRRFNPRLIKIPSTISNHRDYHKKLAANYRGAIVVSTGLSEQEYIDHVLKTYANNEIVYLLHCVSAYPTPRDSCNLAVIQAYNELALSDARIIPGYSSHDLGSTGCMLAVAAGARMLEKHVKLGNVDWIHFDKVAIDLATDDFAKFVHDVRIVEEMVGCREKRILDCEHHKYSVRVE